MAKITLVFYMVSHSVASLNLTNSERG